MPTLCLCMIARNEQHVIERALRSVKHFVDYWIVCDTGSVDATPVIVLNTMSGVPGELHHMDWVNFGHNRGEAVRLAREKADYVLIMDADMIANVHAPFKHKLTADGYEIGYDGDVDYSQLMLVSSRHQWSYVGATHEYIHAPGADNRERLPELTLTHFCDGAMRADKFQRDVAMLTQAIERDPTDPRTTFYLAQSQCDLGNLPVALEWYTKRTLLEGWEEERWYAMYKAAQVRHALGHDWFRVEEAYLAAYRTRPSRVEPLYEVVKHYRECEDYTAGYHFASLAGLHAPYPSDYLFIDKPIHRHLFPLELGVCAYGTGRVSEAIEAFNLVLRNAPTEGWITASAIRGRTMALDDMPPMEHTRHAAARPNRLTVLVPFHNPGEALKRCVQSLSEQDYDNFAVIFMDDASTDDSRRHIPDHHPNWRVLRNDSRRGLARNLRDVIEQCCRPDDVIVCLDGDDSLACSDALSHVDRTYREHDCWVAYSQFQFANGDYGFSQPFASADDFRTLRAYFRTSHLRTFRAGLFQRIAEQDPHFSCLQDENGIWLDSAVDAGLMFPLLEMAGFERVRYIDKILYVYSDENPGNIHRTGRDRQIANFQQLSARKPFRPIDHYIAPAPCQI
ncbi:MAG TPA: glycosyltransferase [Bryobacteraceae bacterium]|nr:glycosyltransferase [Bryobacteraceae bacterium]